MIFFCPTCVALNAGGMCAPPPLLFTDSPSPSKRKKKKVKVNCCFLSWHPAISSKHTWLREECYWFILYFFISFRRLAEPAWPCYLEEEKKKKKQAERELTQQGLFPEELEMSCQRRSLESTDIGTSRSAFTVCPQSGWCHIDPNLRHGNCMMSSRTRMDWDHKSLLCLIKEKVVVVVFSDLVISIYNRPYQSQHVWRCATFSSQQLVNDQFMIKWCVPLVWKKKKSFIGHRGLVGPMSELDFPA